MMMSTGRENLGILCVDDNPLVADALRTKLSRIDGFTWRGWLSSADGLVERAQQDCPAIVLLDIDMPGKNPFEALEELCERCPTARVVVFSGHVRRELIERAVDAGAWGYVSKNDGENALVEVLRRVAADEFALSREARLVYDC